jgi:hypothetical protein
VKKKAICKFNLLRKQREKRMKEKKKKDKYLIKIRGVQRIFSLFLQDLKIAKK